MDILDQLAEARIQEALNNGAFDDLPGAGKPLVLDDDSAVPEDLRVAYRILKNAGFLPPELHAVKEIKQAEQLLVQIEDTAERSRAQLRLQLLRAKLETRRHRSFNLQNEAVYQQKILEHLDK